MTPEPDDYFFSETETHSFITENGEKAEISVEIRKDSHGFLGLPTRYRIDVLHQTFGKSFGFYFYVNDWPRAKAMHRNILRMTSSAIKGGDGK